MYDPIDNKTINWIFMGMYQILMLDFKPGNKSIDCMTGTKELISG